MKLSIRWIFDHLAADWKKYKIEAIVDALNKKTAEVEGFEKIHFELKPFALAQVKHVGPKTVAVECPEWKLTLDLPHRDDLQEGCYYLLKKNNQHIEWASLADWGLEKEGLLPAFYVEKGKEKGGWKKEFETEDYILEVDNKTITNRPDLWCHRGFARELSALLNIKLKSEKEFLVNIPVKEADKQYKATPAMPFDVKKSDAKVCNRFAVYSLEKVQWQPSHFWMAWRLARVDARPIDFIVDATNYVMFDISQPMHAFDAVNFASKTIEPRLAKHKEKLVLLDGSELALTTEDLVITDGKEPVALAGVMGGLKSGVSPQTTSLLIESANFDATATRLSAARHKLRTEASARFEKTLDTNQNIAAIERFVQLLKCAGIPFKGAQQIVSTGKAAKQVQLKLPAGFIEKRLGIELKKGFVKKHLEALQFKVEQSKAGYVVTVPTFRSSKDVTIIEDVVEEVARLYGYENIEPQLPQGQRAPTNNEWVTKLRALKKQLAFSAQMTEVENYALFNNEFLQQINWEIQDGAELANPLSEKQTTLVTSLIPHLLENVERNSIQNTELRFFEVARTWQQPSKKEIIETMSLAGIFYHKKAMDFYWAKDQVNHLCAVLGIEPEWKKAHHDLPQWASNYQTAELYYGKVKLGTAGMVARRIMARLGGGQAFAFELNARALFDIQVPEKKFKKLAKYQASSFDLSMMVPTNVTVAQLSHAIEKADEYIYKVTLLDEFKKAEWQHEKSITMRFWMRDLEKTLSKEQLEKGYQAAQKAVANCGAQLR